MERGGRWIELRRGIREEDGKVKSEMLKPVVVKVIRSGNPYGSGGT